MILKSIAQAEAALLPYVPLVGQLTGKDTVLDRIWPLMELLGNPQDKLKAVHIAGTSGKTSTAYYMSALLTATGKRVGLTVSPHVDSITERVQINGVPLSEKVFCDELGEFLMLVEQAPQKPSYFELMYAFALWLFARHNVDYAVIETGMGGLYDATNVVTRADKICIITDIGFDHTHILGNTLPEIALQKIGIVHEGNTVLTYQQSAEVMQTFTEWTDSHHADLQAIDATTERKTYDKLLLAIPEFQKRNWLLAYATLRMITKRDRLPDLTPEVLQTTQRVQVPARMDTFKVADKTVIMDGAHNPQKMQTFVDSFEQLYPHTKPVVVLALKQSKDYMNVIPILAQLTEHIIVTTFDTSQDLPAKSLAPEVLAEALQSAHIPHISIIKNHTEAYQQALGSDGQIVVVLGSFYLISQIRADITSYRSALAPQ